VTNCELSSLEISLLQIYFREGQRRVGEVNWSVLRITGERTRSETTALPLDMIESISIILFEECQYIFFFFFNSVFSSAVSATI